MITSYLRSCLAAGLTALLLCGCAKPVRNSGIMVQNSVSKQVSQRCETVRLPWNGREITQPQANEELMPGEWCDRSHAG